MPASLTCPECSAALKVSTEAAAGKKVRCPNCQAVFVAPPAKTAYAEARLAPPVEPRPVRRPPPRPERDREDTLEPRRRPTQKGTNPALVIGLVAGGGFLLLVFVCGGIGLLAWLAYYDKSSAPSAPPQVAERGGQFIPPDVNPAPPAPNVRGGGANGPLPPAGGNPRRPPAAGGAALTVVVQGVPNDTVGKFLRDKFARQLPPTNCSIRSLTRGRVMEVVLTPIGDANEFVRKIDYATVTRVEGRTVFVTVTNQTVLLATSFPAPRPPHLPHAPAMPADQSGLVAYWGFDEGKGTEAANPGGPPAHLNRVEWKPGVHGTCLSFKDPDSWVALPSSEELNFPAHTPFAVAAWVQPAKPSGMLLSLRNTEDEAADLDIALEGGGIAATLRYDKNLFGKMYKVSGGKVDDDAWHHFVLQRQADGALELYVDGRGSQTTATEGGPLTTNLRGLGRERYWQDKKPNPIGDAHYQGCIDELYVFKRALKADEIRKLAGQE
jgi:predicted Zn finger-like uncharacterized protein